MRSPRSADCLAGGIVPSWAYALVCFALAGCGSIGFKESLSDQGVSVAPSATSGGRVVAGGEKFSSEIHSYIDRKTYSYVRIENIERGAHGYNSHPVALDAGQLSVDLSKLTAKGAFGSDSLFTPTELEELVPPLVLALGKAKPDEDITFATSDKHGGGGLFQGKSVTTGRVFVQDGKLNVVFGLIQFPFEQEARGSGWLRPFTPGSRAKTGAWKISLEGPGVGYPSQERRDWVAFDESLLVRSSAPTPTSNTGATPTSNTGAMPTSNTGAMPASNTATTPATAPFGGTQAAPPAATHDPDSRYQDIEQRLKVLDRLKQNGLITEQEYREKRRAILKEF